MRKVRLGDFKMLFGEPVPDVVKAELIKKHPNYEAKLLEFLRELEGVVKDLHEMVVMDVDYIVKKAAMKGFNLSPFQTSCNRTSCMTCLGNPKKPYHFPYFNVSLTKPIVVEAPREAKGLQRFLARPKKLYRKPVKQEELKDFLTGIELTKEEIDAFKTVRDLREQFIQFFHALILVSNFVLFVKALGLCRLKTLTFLSVGIVRASLGLLGKTVILVVDMRKVSKLAKEINDFIFRAKEDMIVAEVMLSLTAIPIIQYKEQQGEEKKRD